MSEELPSELAEALPHRARDASFALPEVGMGSDFLGQEIPD